jgi:nanoRNase/pAp phosphatase (c-di-AMP/oligoRNAs hydrolase)
LVIYHGNCPDGFTAAWVTARKLGDVELLAAKYGDDPPLEEATGRRVVIVDFSYPREKLEQLHATGSLLVLDHHKTAEADLQGLPYCVFDMQRSGARLAWDYFREGYPVPWVV